MGFVKCGDFETKNFQLEADYPISRPLKLIATSTKDIKFLSWPLKIELNQQFIFVSDQAEVTIKNPIENMVIKVSFSSEINKWHPENIERVHYHISCLKKCNIIRKGIHFKKCLYERFIA